MFCKTQKSRLNISSWIGLIGGIVLGITLRYVKNDEWTTRDIMYLKFLGSIIVQILKALTIPIIIPSIIVAVGSLNPQLSGKHFFPRKARKVDFEATIYLTSELYSSLADITLVLSQSKV